MESGSYYPSILFIAIIFWLFAISCGKIELKYPFKNILNDEDLKISLSTETCIFNMIFLWIVSFVSWILYYPYLKSGEPCNCYWFPCFGFWRHTIKTKDKDINFSILDTREGNAFIHSYMSSNWEKMDTPWLTIQVCIFQPFCII